MPARTAPTKGRAPAKRGERRRELDRRRGLTILISAIVLSIVLLVAWFPASALLHQRQALAGASSQLADLRAQDRALAQEQAKLTSPGEITNLAREEYQLVQPGQRLVQVLPPPGAKTQGGAGQAPSPGDPGLAAPVRPSAIALLPTGSTTTTAPLSTSTTSLPHRAGAASGGLGSRILRTLEFWRR